MAAPGRGSAPVATGGVAAIVVLCLLLLAAAMPAAGAARKTYVVGDGDGWSRNVARWLHGKTFHAGDVLVFRYDKERHDVAMVSAGNYRRCAVPGGARVLRTGHDRVRLRRGSHHFVCGLPGHCAAGMKMAIRVC